MGEVPKGMEDPKVSGQQKLLIWLGHQGISTLLLIGILYGTWTALPKAIEQIQLGYDKNATQLEKAFETHAKSIDKVLDYAKNDKG